LETKVRLIHSVSSISILRSNTFQFWDKISPRIPSNSTLLLLPQSPDHTHTHTHKFRRPKQSSQNRHQKQGMNLGTQFAIPLKVNRRRVASVMWEKPRMCGWSRGDLGTQQHPHQCHDFFTTAAAITSFASATKTY
jgi:hypothetical protein